MFYYISQFFCFLLIILVAEIAAGAWAYAKSDSLKKLVHESVTTTVRQEYGLIESRTVTFDAIQSGVCHIHSMYVILYSYTCVNIFFSKSHYKIILFL